MQHSTSVEAAQAAREARAREEAASYRFRLIDVKTSSGPVPVVFVTTPLSGSIYTVHSGGRCNCSDAQKRGLKNGHDCKHAVAVRQWLENGLTIEVEDAGEEVSVPASCHVTAPARTGGGARIVTRKPICPELWD